MKPQNFSRLVLLAALTSNSVGAIGQGAPAKSTAKAASQKSQLSADELRNLGKVPQHSEQGLGLGQFLANVSLERLGARLTRENAATGGLITRIIYKAN
ncbi:MAG: hypothetical protein J0M22_17725 [Gammaproteobacteria bacterium]|nr:hypothetical protein [Gammaproteobacteria bacterium]